MKHLLLTLFAAVATVISGHAQSISDLVAKLPPAADLPIQQRAITLEARTNGDFYTTLKSAGWTFDGIKLNNAQVAALAFSKADYDAISPLNAAKFLKTDQYKTWSAAKVLQLGETIAAYDWLQEQRLIVVQAQPKDAPEKNEYLVVVADQVLAAAKAKQD